MVSALDKRKNGNKPIQYRKNEGDKPDDSLIVAEDAFEYIAPCPACERRVLDVDDPPDKPTRVRLKCPHCRKIVRIPISAPR